MVEHELSKTICFLKINLNKFWSYNQTFKYYSLLINLILILISRKYENKY